MDHREKVELTNKRSTADRDRTTDRARERRGGHLSFPGKCGPRMRTPPPPPPKALDSCPGEISIPFSVSSEGQSNRVLCLEEECKHWRSFN